MYSSLHVESSIFHIPGCKDKASTPIEGNPCICLYVPPLVLRYLSPTFPQVFKLAEYSSTRMRKGFSMPSFDVLDVTSQTYGLQLKSSRRRRNGFIMSMKA
jgi:hypothetical protein